MAGKTRGARMKGRLFTFAGLVDSIKTVDSQLTRQASRAVNTSLTLRNWLIGMYIVEYELRGADRAGYGENLFNELADRLAQQKVKGCRSRQLYIYRTFYRVYPQILLTVSAKFKELLPIAIEPSEKVRTPSAKVMGESHLEDALLDKLQDFLLELGHGFCFEARQKRILIGSKNCFVDLVFYHRILKCHVLIELKIDEFNHEHIGQLNTYVSWFKENMMAKGDNPPVGILLCTARDHTFVEYALAGMTNKLFVSKYQLELPKKEEMEQFIQEQMKEVQG